MGLFGKFRNPADAARPYSEQIPGAVSPYYQPYINQGQEVDPRLMETYGRMGQNPMDYLNELMSGYSPSAGFKAKEKRLLETASNASAAGGFSGLPYDQEQQQGIVSALMDDSMQDWIKNVLGIQGTGLEGQQHISDRGYRASTGYGDILGGNLDQQAGLAFQGTAQKNQNRTNWMNLLGGGAGAALGFATQPTGSIFGKKLW
jgi:hypothetical protein